MPVHLGRPRLRARARLDPGVPEEARLDLDHAQLRARRPRRPGAAAPVRVRRHLRRLRAPRRGGDRDARAALRGRPDAQRRRRSSTSATSRGSPRGATTQPAVHELVRAASAATARSPRSGRAPRRSSSTARRTRSTTRSRPCASGKGFRFTFAYTVDDLETVRELEDRLGASRSPASTSRPTTSSAASALRAPRRSRTSRRSTPAARGGRARRRARGRARRRGGDRGVPGLGRARRRTGRAAHLHRLADLIDANVERLAAGRVRGHGDAAPLAARARDRARRAQLPRLRRPRRRVRGARLGVERHAQPRRADAERAGRRDHAVERAVHALDVEDGARARGGLHGRPQAGRVVAALVLAARRPRRRGGLPAGGLQRRPGDRRGGRRRAHAHPGVRRISFTGSPETAVHIGAAAAANIVPFTGELGGKGPLIVFADCDLEAAARKAAGQYDDAGQVCLAGTRLLVEESVARRVPGALPPLHATSTCSATRATTRRPSRR